MMTVSQQEPTSFQSLLWSNISNVSVQYITSDKHLPITSNHRPCDMCTMGQWSFSSWFDVNQSTFNEDMSSKTIFNFHSQWPWPLSVNLSSLLTLLVQRYVYTKLEVSTAFLLRENWRHGMDGQTDGMDTMQNLMQTLGRKKVKRIYSSEDLESNEMNTVPVESMQRWHKAS